MREEIKTYSGISIGYIEDRGNELYAYEWNGRYLGKYDKRNDTTYSSNGMGIARGNILSALIWEKR